MALAAVRRRGLTLVELLVVLLVLAVLAGVAVRSVDQIGVQTRYEATQRTLGELETAVAGEAGVPGLRGPDGQRLVTGFVADLGRVPTSLDELWLRGSVQGFGIAKSPAGDPTLSVAGGWRGPYLRLPVGADDVTDGWGRELETLDEDGSVITSGEIKIVRSLGQDDAVGGSDYERDLYAVWEATSSAVAGLNGVDSEVDRIRGAVAVAGVEASGGGNPQTGDGQFVVIRVYGPDPATGGVHTVAEVVHDLVMDGGTVGFTTLPAPGGGDLTVGPRVVRAYQVATSPTTRDEDLSGADPLSDPLRFTNVPGGVTLPKLVLETP